MHLVPGCACALTGESGAGGGTTVQRLLGLLALVRSASCCIEASCCLAAQLCRNNVVQALYPVFQAQFSGFQAREPAPDQAQR